MHILKFSSLASDPSHFTRDFLRILLPHNYSELDISFRNKKNKSLPTELLDLKIYLNLRTREVDEHLLQVSIINEISNRCDLQFSRTIDFDRYLSPCGGELALRDLFSPPRDDLLQIYNDIRGTRESKLRKLFIGVRRRLRIWFPDLYALMHYVRFHFVRRGGVRRDDSN